MLVQSPERIKQQLKSQSYYSNLLSSLQLFFNIRIGLLIIVCIVVILFVNDLTQVHVIEEEFTISDQTKQRIQHFFSEAENQARYISKSIQKIVQIQNDHYDIYGELYYSKADQLTNVQKMTFEEKYDTNGQYICLDGNCEAIQFFLVNLWAKRNYLNSVQTIYFRYYDPIQNSTNIVYSPADSNTLSIDQIQELISDLTQNSSLEKIDQNLYLKVQSVESLSFDQSYEVDLAIKLKKSEILNILKSEVELNPFHQYHVEDTLGWINYESENNLPRLSYKTGSVIRQMPYISPSSNQTLITFYFTTPQVKLIMDFIKISVLLPVFILIFQFFRQRKIYRLALGKFFRSTRTLISLYEFNIQEIFTGKTPKLTTILNDTTATEFYQQLSQIPSVQYEPISQSNRIKIPAKGFLFSDILKSIVQKYNTYSKIIFRQKNKEIISNKFFIHSSVNEISESESVKIKEAFIKARQLGFVKRFFYFAYLSLLLGPKEFDRLIEEDKSALPQEYIKMTREINRTVSSTDVRKAFKLSPDIKRQTEEELEMRIQINLLQKYLQILKDLDVHNAYAKELKLEDDIENIIDYIENIKHILNKHNKNIRTFGK